jgi:hypothetical protein
MSATAFEAANVSDTDQGGVMSRNARRRHVDRAGRRRAEKYAARRRRPTDVTAQTTDPFWDIAAMDAEPGTKADVEADVEAATDLDGVGDGDHHPDAVAPARSGRRLIDLEVPVDVDVGNWDYNDRLDYDDVDADEWWPRGE